MNNKISGIIGITAVTISTFTIIIMAALRTDGYNHFHKAVSELGSVDAPNKWTFNFLGYIIPGILISIFSLNLLKAFRSSLVKSYPFYFLFLSGLFLALSGVFPGNMENKQSLITIIHFIGAGGSGVFWLLCALTLSWQLKKNDHWKTVSIISFLIPFGMIIAMSFVPKNFPGLSQRITFASYYLYIFILAIKLLNQKEESPIANKINDKKNHSK
ncbi:MAG TPA: DUF998 domain-containing protein [Edaphocola sp.]|nr:DUF998 domain-containing protein [Edaphocola sp.]